MPRKKGSTASPKGSKLPWIILAILIGAFAVYSFSGMGNQVQVRVEGWLKDDLDGGAVTSCKLYVYLSDPTGSGIPAKEFEVVTSDGTTGKLSFGELYFPNQVIYCQVRNGYPDDTDPYVSPIMAIRIPAQAHGEAGDTVSIGNIMVRDNTGTAPTLACEDQGGVAISDNTNYYINTTDTRLQITLSAIDSDTWYGTDDVYDAKTGKSFLGSILVIKSGVAQPISNWDDRFSAGGVEYYIFYLQPFADDSNIDDDDVLYFDVTVSASWVATATFTIDCYDLQNTADLKNAVFDGVEDVTVITTKVA